MSQHVSHAPSRGARLRPLSTLLAVCALVAAVAIAGNLGSASLQRDTLTMLVNLMVVVGLYVFIGNSGVFSFGHLSFMAVGGYVAAILLLDPEMKELLLPTMLDPLQSAHLPGAAATLAGGLAAALLALALSGPLMRLNGLNAGLGTFAVLIIINVVARNWEQGTNGSSGISSIPTVGFGVLLAAAVAIVAIAWAFQQTALCLRVRAVREDEVAARSVGIGVARMRTVAFVLSAFIVGVAGAFFAQAQGAVQPAAFYLQPTFLAIAMLVVGGMTSLSGAVVGTIVISVLARLLGTLESGMDIGALAIDLPAGSRDVGLALTMLLILVRRPQGLLAGREIALPRAARLETFPAQNTNQESEHDEQRAARTAVA